jgi:hypothetical protein
MPSARSSDLLGNEEMRLVDTAEGPADPVGELVVSAELALSGSSTLRLPWIHLGSIGLSHGLFLVGSRQATIRTPP